jgi:hypothetical protein
MGDLKKIKTSDAGEWLNSFCLGSTDTSLREFSGLWLSQTDGLREQSLSFSFICSDVTVYASEAHEFTILGYHRFCCQVQVF